MNTIVPDPWQMRQQPKKSGILVAFPHKINEQVSCELPDVIKAAGQETANFRKEAYDSKWKLV